MKKICHMSSAHRGLDIRIFRKECVSLAGVGYDTHLVINASAADVAEAARHNVTLHALDYVPESRRFSRMFLHARRCYAVARALDADLYHFHDPELIPYGLLLAWAGKKVIFDAHEDLPGSVHTKDWVPLPVRRLVAGMCRVIEHAGARRFDAVVAATPFIGRLFETAAKRVVVVNNYPLFGELAPSPGNAARLRDSVCYVGGIDAIRGIRQIVQALASTEVILLLAGQFASSELQLGVASLAGWERVEYYGTLSRQGVTELLERSFAGLVTFLAAPNHINAQPNKMFEYMSAGVPVIASDFPLWHDIVEGNQCGICVRQNEPDDIAAAIRYLHAHPAEVLRMGNNGRRAVEQKYRWDCEEIKLLSLYRSILGSTAEQDHDGGIDAQRCRSEAQ